MRPYIICHMVASVDGKIDCAMVDKISGDEYYTTLDKLDCPSFLEGRVTLAHYRAMKKPFVSKRGNPANKPSVHVAAHASGYAVAVDTRGRLRWPSGQINGKPMICLVSEQATEEYLEALRLQDISWIALGKNAIDLPGAMEILHEQFHIKRMSVLGGGHINGGLLHAGLIDEVSLLLAPGIDGRKGRTTVFDGIADPNCEPVNLTLEHVVKMDNGTLWLRYHIRQDK